MSIRVALHHRTTYHFDRSVSLAPHLIRLRPAPHVRTPVHQYSLMVQPKTHFLNWQQDPFGNYIARYVFPEKTRELDIIVDLVAEMVTINPFDFFVEPEAKQFPFDYAPQLRKELAPYFERTESGPLLTTWVASVKREPTAIVDFLVGLNQRLQSEIGYVIRMEPGVQRCEETLKRRKGSCRDTGWLLVQILRHLGLAARFVSGYLVQLTADIKALDGPSGPKQDFTDLHAWAEVFVPGAGWIGLDPTSGLFAGEGHIPLACTPDPVSAAPVTGALDPCEVSFSFENRVTRIHEDPRVTKPYDSEQWSAVLRLGAAVDAELQAQDVRLTMGGEPTFVSIDDMDAPEWNTGALGDHKRERAEVLLRRLWKQFGQGGLLHYGQGKWYPGEPLPRWSLSCLWRADGKPLWQSSERLADPTALKMASKSTSTTTTASRSADQAHESVIAAGHALIEALADELGIAPGNVQPGHEDALYYLWKEGGLPPNVDVLDNKLRDPLERDRLRRLFDQGLDSIVGFALPLAWDYDQEAWTSNPWRFRRGRMFLLPGDSPMGLRLPLDALLWEPETERQRLLERDPFAPDEDLPGRDSVTRGEASSGNPQGGDEISTNRLSGDGSTLAPMTDSMRKAAGIQNQTKQPAKGAGGGGQGTAGSVGLGKGQGQGEVQSHYGHLPSPPKDLHGLQPQGAADLESRPRGALVRTALCVEPRDGVLHVFLPPLTHLSHWLKLIHALEAAVERIDLDIVLEGYEPPEDPRLRRLQVTPDPGVIEVNIHPASSWDELRENTEILYEEARLSRLGTEKFMLDGRHSGTGGGNHVTIGGATPADSPLLRRPQVLGSLLRYWQNHPSLSYLFSGLFIGPTSQAPRVDEARDDSLYELEIALDRLPEGDIGAPWLVDRLLRNLLIDVTGNTHRAEFCIDKLYSPDSAVGRRGLVEFRGFEMPPHSRMSLVQMLLLRTLVARFWQTPYEQAPVRWGTELHDRFMLPHFVERDIRDVAADLNRWGYVFDPHWFDPFLEFRFPRYGSVNIDDVELELRFAIEPWHVLGEEVTAQGTARFVDSSVERLQVKARGLIPSRHQITCNGRVLPLRNTGARGDYVAGVRYKAWDPPSGLHPTIGVQAPLVFDLHDTWTGRSLGGCTYRVAHPGGRNYETLPVNANEAEARRLARFQSMGHSPGALSPPMEAPADEFSYTLDLRRRPPDQP